MSNLRGVILQKGKPKANNENMDSCCGLIVNVDMQEAQTNPLPFTHDTTYSFLSLSDAEYFGITKEFDESRNVVLHRHISEFFRIAPKNTKLYFMAVGSLTSMSGIISMSKKLILEAKGEIRNLAVAYNPTSDYKPQHVDGLEEEVRASIASAQEVCNWAFEVDYPVNIVLEGRGTQMSPAVLDLRNIDVSGNIAQYNNVSLCVAQDYDYAEKRLGHSQQYADVGTMLGTISKVRVNQNIGEVGEEGDLNSLDISNVIKEIWITAGFSNHTRLIENTFNLQTYENKGYVFAVNYVGATGYRWNNDHTCTPIIIDDEGTMNIHSISLASTYNKLSRLVRKKLLPKVKSNVPIDVKTGLMPQGIVKYFEDLGSEAIVQMQSKNEISGGVVSVDPNSNLFGSKKELGVSFTMIPTGTIGQIKGVINIKKSI